MLQFLVSWLPSACIVLVLYKTLSDVLRRIAITQKAKELGCEQPVQYPHFENILGFDLFLGTKRALDNHRLLEYVLERFTKYGRTHQMMAMGIPVISTIEPENVKTVLSLKFKDFGLGERRKTSFWPLLGQGIFTTDGGAWEHSRALLRPNFTRAQVADLATFEAHIQDLIASIPFDGSTVDLQDLFFRLTLDSATEFLFGESCNSLAPGKKLQSAVDFASAFNYTQDAIGHASRLGPLGAFRFDPRFKRDTKTVHDFVDKYVQRAIAYRKGETEKEVGDEHRYVFLHELSRTTDDPIRLRSELLNVLLAGRDTTASLLGNTWFILARRPDIWAKLRAEVDVLCGEAPSYEQIKEMKYLRYVLNECESALPNSPSSQYEKLILAFLALRLMPVVPLNGRTAIRDTVIPTGGGPNGTSPIFVPKDTAVAYPVYVMHRRRDFFGEDADDFNPDRWEKLRPGWEYLPFNGGPRICLGQQFALTEASYTTVRLMQRVKSIESRDDKPWTESLTLTCCSLHGTQVSLTPM
ncbi:MAG: hypothetical protein M1834_000080 [Cirrosporium novae-zelandiae]|nr:MAG: hypothetical protein M1834_000080 [Cirrosporium novae-zelandiae]